MMMIIIIIIINNLVKAISPSKKDEHETNTNPVRNCIVLGIDFFKTYLVKLTP